MFTTFLILAVGMVPQDWYTFAPEGKNFRVDLPSKPNRTLGRTFSNAAGRSQLTAAQSNASDAIYSIQVTENSGRVDPKTLDDGIRRFSEDKGATLGAVKPITVDGNPGRDFEMTERSDEGQIRSRMRWVTSGNLLLMLMAAGKPGAEVPAGADRFLGSLKIGVVNGPDASRTAPDRGEAMAKGPDPAEARPKAAPKAEVRPALRKPVETPKVATTAAPKGAKSYPPEALEDVPRSYLAEREGFRDVGPAGSVLVGVRVTYVERFGGYKVRSAQPIYRSKTALLEGKVYGEVVGPVQEFVARPGYAVGGLVTHTGLTVDGFRMVFMKVDGDRLNPDDSYNTPWIGDELGGGPGEVASKGGPAVGLQGRSHNEVFALGLTTLK
jgi:hypothetical protein